MFSSITANLAEGSGRQSPKEKTACDLNYISTEQLDALRPKFTEVAKMLSGLRNKFQEL